MMEAKCKTMQRMPLPHSWKKDGPVHTCNASVLPFSGQIEAVSTYKILGDHVDCDLKWSIYVGKVLERACLD